MPFKTGKAVHEDGGFTIARHLQRQDDGSYAFAGFSLIGADIDPSFRYGSLDDAKVALDRVLGRSISD